MQNHCRQLNHRCFIVYYLLSTAQLLVFWSSSSSTGVTATQPPPWIVQVWSELWCRQIRETYYDEPNFAMVIRCSGTLLAPNYVLTAGRCFAVADDLLQAKSLANCSVLPLSNFQPTNHFNNVSLIEARHIRVYAGDGKTWRDSEFEAYIRSSRSSWQAARIHVNPKFSYFSQIFLGEDDDDVAFNDLAIIELVLPNTGERAYGLKYPNISNSEDSNCYDDCRSTAWNYVLDRDPLGDASNVETRSGTMKLEQFDVTADDVTSAIANSKLCSQFLASARDLQQFDSSQGDVSYFYRCFSSLTNENNRPASSTDFVAIKEPLLDHGCHFDIGAPLICKNRRQRNEMTLVSGISITNQCQWLFHRHRRVGIFQSLAPHYSWIMSVLNPKRSHPNGNSKSNLYDMLFSTASSARVHNFYLGKSLLFLFLLFKFV